MMGGYSGMVGFGGLGMLVMALFWIGVIVLVVWGLSNVFSTRQPRVELDTLEIVKRRYARGEISREEFLQARKAAEKESKKGGTGMPRMPAMPVLDSPGTSVSSAGVPTTKLPSLEELLAEQGAKRAADDIAVGYEGLEERMAPVHDHQDTRRAAVAAALAQGSRLRC